MRAFDFLNNAVRAKEIVTVLARYGFADLMEQIEPSAGFWGKFLPKPKTHLSTFERIRLAAEELGPTFVKFGQLLSMRPDVVPEPLVIELRKLQDDVKPLPYEAMKTVLEEELLDPPESLFSEFNPTPIASASLAQVYVARLRFDQRAVAIKVQRPNLHKMIDADLDLITWFAHQLHQRVPGLRPYDLPAVVEEVKDGFLQELDFRQEARNMQYFNAQNPYKESVFAPHVVEEISTRRVLVMDYVAGTRIEEAVLSPDEAKRLADQGAKSMFHQIILEGFFHADPHGGNIMITSDRRICLLDWGLVGQLTRRMRYFLADLFSAAAENDPERVVQIAAGMATPGRKVDVREMEKQVTFTLRESLNYAIGREELGRTILKLLYIFGSHGVNVARDFSLMAKAVWSTEEAGKQLDPDFSLRQTARPILKELQRERWSPSTGWRNLRGFFGGSLLRLQELPGDIERIFRRLSQDDLTINFQHRGLEEMDDALNASSSRLTLGVIIGALIIGSSIIVTTGIRPLLFGYPAMGIVGFLLSALLGFWVVWDIVRHGRHR